MKQSHFPVGWSHSTFGELFSRLQYGFTAKASFDTKGTYFLRITDLCEGDVDWESVPRCEIDSGTEAYFLLEEGDFVFARSGSIEKAWRVVRPPQKAVFASYLIRGRLWDSMLGGWLEQFIRSSLYLKQIGAMGAGIAMKNVNARKLASVAVPVPPLNEQKRIVAKLEALRGHSSRARAALEAVEPLLERFRQSVLAAAFRGDLTRKWREQHPDVEPAEVLLERIRAERKARWVDEEAEKARAKAEEKARKAGQAWGASDNREVLERERAKAAERYEEPEPIDPTGLPALPNGWCWAWLTDCGEMSRGKSKHRPRNDPKLFVQGRYPFIQTGDISQSFTIRGSEQFYNEFGLSQSRLFPSNTVCITIAANIAQTAILHIPACFPDSVVGIITEQPFTAEFVEFYMRSVRSNLETFAPGTAQKNINLDILKKVVIPLPPKEEMNEINKVLNSATACAETSEDKLGGLFAFLNKLDQSILSKAFRGELVEQDPSDEPAEVLLKRIRAERRGNESGGEKQGEGGEAGGKKRGRKKKG